MVVLFFLVFVGLGLWAMFIVRWRVFSIKLGVFGMFVLVCLYLIFLDYFGCFIGFFFWILEEFFLFYLFCCFFELILLVGFVCFVGNIYFIFCRSLKEVFVLGCLLEM